MSVITKSQEYKIDDYITYDEMAISAMISFSWETPIFNDGDSKIISSKIKTEDIDEGLIALKNYFEE